MERDECTCAIVCLWRSEDNSRSSVLPPSISWGGIPVVARLQAPSPARAITKALSIMFVRFINVMAYSLLSLVWLYHTLFIWLFVPLTIRWCKHTYT